MSAAYEFDADDYARPQVRGSIGLQNGHVAHLKLGQKHDGQWLLAGAVSCGVKLVLSGTWKADSAREVWAMFAADVAGVLP